MYDTVTKSGPLPSQVTFDVLLTTVAVAYLQDLERYSTRAVFPVVEVKLQSGKYDVYERGAFYRDEVKERPRGGRFPVTGFSQSKEDYTTTEEGLSTFIDDQDRANSTNPDRLERMKIRLLTQQIHTHYERGWAGKYFRAGVWIKDKLGVAAGPGAGQVLQFDQAGVDLPSFVRRERDDFELGNGGFPANCMVVGKAVHRAITGNAEIKDLIKHTQIGVPTVELLKALFGVDHYIVPGAIWNSAAEGLPEKLERIVGERGMLLCHRTAEVSEATALAPTAGVTFAWTGLVPGGGLPNGTIIPIHRYRDGNPYVENFDARTAFSQQTVSEDLGWFYQDIVSAAA